ncbi:MAG TPA: DUF6788 family protein [Candidatus Hodarchaeales archaeon]|nr:DUF6788 family protein [Candidatus Hodarchaeales archaeon]
MVRLEELEQKKAEILEKFQGLGDLRRGSMVKRFIPCRKGNCHCLEPSSRGHGPKYSLTFKVNAKTKTEYVPIEKVKEVTGQLSEHKKFLQLCREFVEVNEEICRLRSSGKKKKLRDKG